MIDNNTFNDDSFFDQTLAYDHRAGYFIKHFFDKIHRDWQKLDWDGNVRIWFIQDNSDGDYCYIATQDERELSELIDIEKGRKLREPYYIEEVGDKFPLKDYVTAFYRIAYFHEAHGFEL